MVEQQGIPERRCRALARKARQAEILHWLEVRKLPPLGRYEKDCIIKWVEHACPLLIRNLDQRSLPDVAFVPGEDLPECVVTMSHATLYAYRWIEQAEGLVVKDEPRSITNITEEQQRSHEALAARALAYEEDVLAGRREPEVTVEDAIAAFVKHHRRPEDWQPEACKALRIRWLIRDSLMARRVMKSGLGGVLRWLLLIPWLCDCRVSVAWLAAFRMVIGGSPWNQPRFTYRRSLEPPETSAEVAACLQATRIEE